jgi:TetR/AcrR family tetracycline transcriptional repressor
MPLRREQVVRAALELLDEVGLDAFTTRALTDRLGVQRGALYWHVSSKRELLTAVTELIVRPVLEQADAAGGDWIDAFTVFAHRLREALLAHRDGARLLAGHVTLTRGMGRLEARLAELAEQGVPPELGLRFTDTIASYVTGYVLQEQAVPDGLQLDPGADTPLLRRWLDGDGADSGAVFTASVHTIILGMRAELAARGRSARR